jgi:hypothetical protein
MNLLYVAVGILLLILGRKFFWLFVAAIGFLIGTHYAPLLFPTQPQSVILTISLISGLLGALLAVLLQKFAVGLAGLVAGGYITYYVLQFASINAGQYQWLAIIAGAIIGAVMAGSMFDWALILITSASGSVLINQGINVDSSIAYLFLIGLFIVGVIVQGRIKVKE